MQGSNANARGRRPLRRLVGGLAGLVLALVVLLAGAALLIQARIDPDALRQRIQRRCLEATGRTLRLDHVSLSLLPVPTLSATGVTLSGLPTDQRPQMLSAASASAHLALWPLIHRVARLDGVTLVDPDLHLERDAAGHANWHFTPLPKQPGNGPGSAAGDGARWQVQINSLRLRDGALSWRDAVSGWSGAVSLDRLDATGLAGDAPRLALNGRHGSAGFDAQLSSGALSRLLDAPDAPGASAQTAAWPLHLSARSSRNARQDVSLSVDGALSDPAHGRGFAFDLVLDAAHPDGIDALFPHAAIPAAGPVALRTRLVDAASPGDPSPQLALQRLSLDARQLDLGALLHRSWSRGLVLARVVVNGAAADAPLAVSADGTWQGRPVSVEGTAGTLAALLQASRARGGIAPATTAATTANATTATTGPVPFDLRLRAGDATARLQGVADRDSLRGTVQATASRLRSLLPVGPALTGMTLQASLAVSADRRIVVDALELQARELALAGHATLTGGAHPAIDAVLSSTHADLDALRAGWVDASADQAADTATGADSTPANATRARPAPAPNPAANPAATPGASAPAPGAGATAAIPPGEHAVPFERLRCCDASIRFGADTLVEDGTPYHAVSATLALHDGVLVLAPFTATGPAGPIDLSLHADADRQSVALLLHPAVIPAATLENWLHRSAALQGPVELVADLRAAGATTEAMRRDAEGHLGLSMVDGSIATEALGQLIGRPQAAMAGSGTGASAGGGRTGFRCLALPATLSSGIATLDPVALSTSRLVVQGRGTVALADGRLDLHLTPRLAIGATGASLPVRIGGTLDAPEAALDPAAPGGRFSLSIGGAAPPDPCGAALAAARFGVAGPLPGAAPPEGRHKLPKPLDILRGLGLFR